MAYTNVEIAFAALLAGALVAGFIRSWRPAGWTATAFVGIATAFAWADGLKVLLCKQDIYWFIAHLPRFGSNLAVSLDPLGAGFLMLITGVSLVATAYSVSYMEMYRHESPRRFYSLLLLFIAGMIGVVSVSDWLFFIVFWELMTLASYFLVVFEGRDPQAVRAGFKYFMMTHVATAGLLITAVVLWRATGSFAFAEHGTALATMSVAMRSILLALYLIAFSTKAGILPMGDWLPDAYPAAPSGVSAIFAGVMSKLGVYAILRVFWDVLPQTGNQVELLTWGAIIAFLGTLSAFVGGVTAMKENDAKRLLAFSSISQMGYIFLALGIAVAFSRSEGLESLAVLALLGAGFHILNDAVYKSLLFMNAGSILYSTGTRDLNRIGGLSSVMPMVAAAGLVGVASLSGLPLTNGFASKWLIYQSSISGSLKFAPFVVAAVTAFFVSLSTLAYSLKYYDTAFLGKAAAGSHEPRRIPTTMMLPQCFLAVVCIAIGLAPAWALRGIASVFQAPSSGMFMIGRVGGLATVPGSGVVPASWSPVLMLFIFIVCLLVVLAIRRSGSAKTRAVPSWYGGEEYADDEVRFRARGFYSPFNLAFAKVYPHVPIPRLPSLKRLRSVLDLDSWLYGPLLRAGGSITDKVSRSHVGIPQLYMIWQVIGMIVVLVTLILLVR